MRLKRVRIYGFKTFADKTEIDIDGGIISVVGPNGCGKSNIVDAILWGLGETNARSLRAQASQEVIFSGSARRKPLGYSEVSLLFDNEDGSLPIDTPEVLITRRLSRSGESTYSINRRNCRLRDVVDLLADSGLGRTGYAIVTQSEIDQALAASAQQRRAWIDEAAGVQRYRIRRQDAQRRLTAAGSHLEQVRTLIREIESQMGPLESEAEVARRHRALSKELRSLEVGLLAREAQDAEEELVRLQARGEETTRSIAQETERAGVLEEERKAALADQARLDDRIEALRSALSDAQAQRVQAEGAIQVAEAKLENLDRLEGQLAEEVGASAERIATAERDLEEAKLSESKEMEALDELKQSLAGADEETGALSKALDEAESHLAKARALVQEIQKRDIESAHRKERSLHLQEEKRGILQTLPDLEQGLVEAQGQTAEAESALSEAKASLLERQNALKSLAGASDQAHGKTRALMSELGSLEGKIKGLAATLDSNEGLTVGSRAVMELVNAGMLRGSYIPVGQAVTASPELALAIETALGGAVHDLIVPDEGHAKAAIQQLKEKRLGRATFQPLTMVKGGWGSDDLHRLKRERGVVGIASELVDCDSDHRQVVESLLGRVLVVEDLDAGLRLPRNRSWNRVVTLEGEVINASGSVTGGAHRHQGYGMVQRRAELGELEAKAAQIQAEIRRHQSALQDREARQKALQLELEKALQAVRDKEGELAEAKSWLASLNHERQSTERSLARLEAEEAQLAQEGPASSEPLPDLESLQQERDRLLQALAGRQADAQQALQRRQELDARASQAVLRTRECTRRLASLHEAEAARSRRSGSIAEDREKLRLALAAAREEEVKARAVVGQREEEVSLAVKARRLLVEEAARLAEEAKKAAESAAAFSATLHQVELSRARVDGKRNAAIERLLEEYGLLPEEAREASEGAEITPDASQRVNSLRREIKSLGEVNLGAIDAYERLSERSQELIHQVEDIEKGKEEIEAGIKELDRLTRERFVSTFAKLKEEFAQMFQRIFSGGEGLLELTEGESILDAGVEIAVTIPGKKRQRLELLSGGERALSALAFLFSLLKVKPSPLVILDEVDAPLDGRNVERFIAMMREMASQTQFILITHNTITIESADVWFGVTMQEPGVSTVIPFKAPPFAKTQVSLKG